MHLARAALSVLRRTAGRRPAWVAGITGGLAVLVVGGLIQHVTGSGNSATQQQSRVSVAGYSTSPTNQRHRYGALDLGIAYGSTPKQVLRQLGAPTKKQAGCWLYRGQEKIHDPYADPEVDAMKFCYSEGPAGGNAVTQILSHYPTFTVVKKDPLTHAIVSKKTVPARWGHPIWLMKVPDWYLQQNN